MKEYSLGELVRANRPITYGIVQPGPDVNPNGVPLIRGKDYSSGKVATEGLYHVLPEIDKPYTRSKVEAGDVLLSIAGYVGQIAIVPEQLSGANITQTTARLSCDDNKVISKFLFYVLQSETFYRTQVKKHEKGSAQSGLNLSDVGTFKVDLPPLPQQSKIAKILSTCDDVIEKTEAAIAKYQALKQGMMHDLFTRGIDIKTGKLRPSYQDAPELYKECELGMIPKEWEKCTFKDISSVNQGLQIPISLRHKTEGVNRFVYITIQYLNDIENEANRYYIENPTTSVVCNEDDVLMVRTGNTGMIVTNIVGAFHNNFFKIDYGKNVVKEFLVYHLKRKSIQSIILNYAGTTTIPDLKHGDFYNLPFMMPSQIEQKIISTRLEGIDNKLQTEQSALAKYQQLKAGLMQDLLTGKVEVSVAEEILKN